MQAYYLACAIISGVKLNKKGQTLIKAVLTALVLICLAAGGPFDD